MSLIEPQPSQAVVSAEPASAPVGPMRRVLEAMPPWSGALLALLILMAITGAMNPAFFRATNLLNILDQNAAIGIVAVGMTLVIILGGIDLSVGSLLALAGGVGILTLNALYQPGQGDWLAVISAVAVMVLVGCTAGLVNGLLIAWGGLAPFIATLGALVAFRSAAVWMADGGQFFSQGAPTFASIGWGLPIPGTNIARPGAAPLPMSLPISVPILIVVAVTAHVLLFRTRLGRYIIAVGSNERAAVYSAIPVARIKTITYTLLGGMTGLAALVWAARFQSVNSANAGLLLELEAIAAVVIGGTRMQGGSGSIIGTLIGVLLLGVIKNMMVMLGVTSHAHGMVMGLIIIAAVLVQRLGSRS